MHFDKFDVLRSLGALVLVFGLFFSIHGQGSQNHRPATAVGFTGTYSQDFQSFTLLTNTVIDISQRTMFELAGFADGGAIQGWYVYGLSTESRWGRNKGNNSTGAFYSIYTGELTPSRAFGSLASTRASGYFGVVLRNDTPNSIVSVSVSYDAVIARNPSSTVNDFPVRWLVNASAPSTVVGDTGAGTFNDAAAAPDSWHTPGDLEEMPDILSFSTPTSGIGGPGGQALIDPFFVLGTKTQVLRGIAWNPGQYLYIRWYDKDEAGSDALAGIDNFQISLVTTAADAVVKGQVVDSFGGGISGAMVTLISPRGERRTVITSSFGYFRFSAVETGETYVVTASSKRHRFEPRSVTVADNIDDLRITALP